MKRSPLKRIGKVGEANIKSRRMIAEICESLNLSRCEIRLGGCLISWPLAPAHRHKRIFYKGDADRLADYRQWVCACQRCHDIIEHNPELTEQIFQKLRGNE